LGRLKRKKTSYKKKKKKQSAGIGASSQTINDAIISKTTLLTEPSRDTKQMQVKPSSTGFAPAAEKLKKGYLDKGLQFLREVKVELKKVTWPSRKQTIGSTVVVIVLVIIISLFLGIVDIGLSSIIRVVLQ